MTIIKEYRITLPITVDEYQVAQLYSVAESSKVSIFSKRTKVREIRLRGQIRTKTPFSKKCQDSCTTLTP